MTLGKYYLETYGCTYNKADSERIQGLLTSLLIQTDTPLEADFLIINSCAVKLSTENKILAKMEKLCKLEKKIILCGCIPQVLEKNIEKILDSCNWIYGIFDTKSLDKFPLFISKIREGTKIFFFAKKRVPFSKFDLPRRGLYRGVEILPISESCRGNCTYCCTKFARDTYFSVPSKRLVQVVSRKEKGPISVYWVTAQDCSVYQDRSIDLCGVITQILREKGRFFVRLGMINPRYCIDRVGEFIKLFNSDARLFQFFHIPIQSGSDRILRAMGRNYTTGEAVQALKKLKAHFPKAQFATDIICGFPGESSEDFLQTIEVVKTLKPSILNISQFSTREGTRAKAMIQVKSGTIKSRSKSLTNLHSQIKEENLQSWSNWIGNVVVEKKLGDNRYLARNLAYLPIFIEDVVLGNIYRVKIKKRRNKLIARVISKKNTFGLEMV